MTIASTSVALLPHLWTVVPRLRHSFRPRPVPESRAWEGWVEDSQVGRLRLNGRFRPETSGEEGLVVVHGLGGSAGSHYMGRMARAAQAAGLPCLRLNLRGSDREGEDFYHAGLTADLHAALASPELAPYRWLYVVGYSLGGHLTLRAATEEIDPRLVAVAAVCSPLDLARSQRLIDGPSRWLYRHYLLRALNAIYAGVAARRPVPCPPDLARRIRSIREWDDRIVAPRHGFIDAGDYYAQMSVAPQLDRLRVPALLLNAEHDPMVATADVRPSAQAPRLTARFLPEGGHVGFPEDIDAHIVPEMEIDPERGFVLEGGVEAQVLAWLRSQRSTSIEAPQ